MEYVQIVKESAIPMVNDVRLTEFCNVYSSQKVLDQILNKNVETVKRGKFQMVKIKRWSKGRIQGWQKNRLNDGKHNMSLIL